MIASCTTISLLSFSGKDFGQSVFSLVLVIILAILPFLYTYVMYRNSVHLEMMSKKERIGSLYVNMNADKVSALAYVIIFLIRRCFFSFVTFALTNYAHL